MSNEDFTSSHSTDVSHFKRRLESFLFGRTLNQQLCITLLSPATSVLLSLLYI